MAAAFGEGGFEAITPLKPIIAQFRPRWHGGSEQVELLEKFALSWINLAIMQGHGRGIGFKVVRR
jgi:hypothetical protein